MIASSDLAVILREWIEEGGTIDTTFGSYGRSVRSILAGEREEVGIDVADKILVKIGRQEALAEIAPPPATGKRSGVWAKPHPLRRLTQEQVAAAHTLHLAGGLSIRELGRQLWQPLGYSTPKSCAQAISSAFRRAGLERRDRIAATVAASTVHGHGARSDRAAYKRWHRSTFGPWPSDNGHRTGTTASLPPS